MGNLSGIGAGPLPDGAAAPTGAPACPRAGVQYDAGSGVEWPGFREGFGAIWGRKKGQIFLPRHRPAAVATTPAPLPLGIGISASGGAEIVGELTRWA